MAKENDKTTFRDTDVKTLQSNIKCHETDMRGYSLFLGGLNVKNAALEQYDVLKTGKGRIFFTKMPLFMNRLMPNATKNFKHVLEYGFMKDGHSYNEYMRYVFSQIAYQNIKKSHLDCFSLQWDNFTYS